LRPGQFINPGGLGVDPEGNMYATNFGENNNVRKFQQRWKLLIIFGVSGRGNGQFENPIELVVYPADNEYVGDSRNNRIQLFGNN
jgi:DNA-binding beta-propeller fold protein YncE